MCIRDRYEREELIVMDTKLTLDPVEPEKSEKFDSAVQSALPAVNLPA